MSNLATGFINDVYSYGNTGSSMANAVSYGAQQAQQDFNANQANLAYQRDIDLASMQMAYNSAAAAEQRAYNESMWEKQVQANRENMQAQQAFNHAEAILAREFNSAEAQKAREFNASEAEKQRVFNKAEAALAREFSKEEAQALRNWQETMSNTSYQRAVQDMKLAGINPILAYAQGGASTPNGAMGSSSMATGTSASSGMASSSMASSGLANSGMASSGMQSMGLESAPMASSGNFTGQGNNMSENLAIFGAIASMFGQGMSGLAESIGLFGQSLDLTKFAENLGKAFKGDAEGTENLVEDVGKTLGIEKTGGGLIGLFDKWFGNSKYNQHSEANTDFWNRLNDKYGN